MHGALRSLTLAGLLALAAMPAACTSPAPPPPPADPALWGDFTPVVSVKELMRDLLDPLADNIFNAVGTTITKDGTVDVAPRTDEDWDRVRIGAVALAEGSYLLKIRRPFAPPGDENNSQGPEAVELSPAAISAKVDRDPVEWNARIEALRNVGLEVLDIVKRRDADALWGAGEDLDTACEACHRSYWYPGETPEFYQRLRHRLDDVRVQAPDAGAAFRAFFAARTPAEAASAADAVVAAGIGFDEALARLKRGRAYAADVPTGVVQASYRGADGAEYFYTLDVPETYDPARPYRVRVQLHGGVGRIETNAPPRPSSNPRLAVAGDEIGVRPYAWRDAPWWTARQVGNLRAILDRVKRAYNVDENAVVLSGVSDGGTGAYYVAMRDTTPFASFLPLNGFVMVLKNETTDADGDLFPNNLTNKPLFVVNGGRDPLYPTSAVEPYVNHLKSGGVAIDYHPQPNAGHDTSWWPEVRDTFEQFVVEHPRRPYPDALSWESGPPNLPSRAHWLVIDRLADPPVAGAAGGPGSDAPPLPDVNRMASSPAMDFGIRGSGVLVNRVVKGSNAEAFGLRTGDRVRAINSQPTSDGTDLAGVLHDYPAGRPLLLTVERGGASIRLTGRYAPTVLAGEADAMFPPQRASGRVDVARTGNRVDASTRGVAAFTLLLSPDQFDLDRAVTVVVNGQTVFDAVVRRDVRTLLAWAARDNDRTMLFGAELRVEVPR